MTELILIRHGETAWNRERRKQGQTDTPLSDTGRAQAQAVGERLARYPFAALYSSDLSRTLDTATAVAERLALKVQPLALLRERHYGIFQGITALEGKEKLPDAYANYLSRVAHYRFETGESLQCFSDRARNAMEWMLHRHQGQTIAAISHGGVLDVLYRHATGRTLESRRDFDIPNCALNWFLHDGQRWHLESWADRQHLAEVLLEEPE